MRLRKSGLYRDRHVVGLERLIKTLQPVKRIAAIAVGTGIPRPQRNDFVEAGERLFETVKIVETRSEIPEGGDCGRIERERFSDQLDAALGTICLQGNDTGQVQSIKMVRLGFEDLLVQNLRLPEAALLVGGQPLPEFFLNRQLKLPRMRKPTWPQENYSII